MVIHPLRQDRGANGQTTLCAAETAKPSRRFVNDKLYAALYRELLAHRHRVCPSRIVT